MYRQERTTKLYTSSKPLGELSLVQLWMKVTVCDYCLLGHKIFFLERTKVKISNAHHVKNKRNHKRLSGRKFLKYPYEHL